MALPFNLDLDVLRTFVTGLDLGSYAKAAGRLGRSQSAISLQLRKLEETTGQTLLRKQGRGLALTRRSRRAGTYGTLGPLYAVEERQRAPSSPSPSLGSPGHRQARVPCFRAAWLSLRSSDRNCYGLVTPIVTEQLTQTDLLATRHLYFTVGKRQPAHRHRA